jgi:hypothetical protein
MIWQIYAVDTFLACKNWITAWNSSLDHCSRRVAVTTHAVQSNNFALHVLPMESSQLLCNKYSESKTTCNDIIYPVNLFLDCPAYPEDGGSWFLQNVSKQLPEYMVSDITVSNLHSQCCVNLKICAW